MVDQTAPFEQQAPTVYIGLNRGNPVLFSGTTPNPNHGATLTVTLTGGTYPQPPTNYTTNYVFAAPQSASTSLVAGPSSATVTLGVGWYAPSQAPISGTLFVLQVQSDDAGLPIAYSGYGTANATLTDEVAASTTVELEPVTPSTLTGSFTLPSGYRAIELDSFLDASPTANFLLVEQYGPPEEFSYLVPSVAGTTVSLQVLALGDDGSLWIGGVAGLGPNSSAISLSCQPAPTLLTPTDQMTGVTDATTLSWSAYPNGIYELILGVVTYWTASPSTTFADLPDLSSFGFGPLQPSVEYDWVVYGISPYPTVDSWTDPETVLAPRPSFCEGVAVARTFTTAPTPATDGGSASNGRSTPQVRSKRPVSLPTFR